MIYTFTGSRSGCSGIQLATLNSFVFKLRNTEYPDVRFLHGGCRGGDTEFHELLFKWEMLSRLTVCPSNMPWTQDQLLGSGFKTEDPDFPLVRNHRMVDESQRLFACPDTLKEIQRSGTWATVRYARKKKLQLYLILPDGSMPEAREL